MPKMRRVAAHSGIAQAQREQPMVAVRSQTQGVAQGEPQPMVVAAQEQAEGAR